MPSRAAKVNEGSTVSSYRCFIGGALERPISNTEVCRQPTWTSLRHPSTSE